MSSIDIDNSGDFEVGGDLAGRNITKKTITNYEKTKETIGALTEFADKVRESDPILSQALQSFFDNQERLIVENKNLWRSNDDLRATILVANENHNSALDREKGLIERIGRLEERALVNDKYHKNALDRERRAHEKIARLERDIDNCPSFRFKAFVLSLGVYAVFSTPIILLDVYRLYNILG